MSAEAAHRNIERPGLKLNDTDTGVAPFSSLSPNRMKGSVVRCPSSTCILSVCEQRVTLVDEMSATSFIETIAMIMFLPPRFAIPKLQVLLHHATHISQHLKNQGTLLENVQVCCYQQRSQMSESYSARFLAGSGPKRPTAGAYPEL